jgi:hypothetical protein
MTVLNINIAKTTFIAIIKHETVNNRQFQTNI